MSNAYSRFLLGLLPTEGQKQKTNNIKWNRHQRIESEVQYDFTASKFIFHFCVLLKKKRTPCYKIYCATKLLSYHLLEFLQTC